VSYVISEPQLMASVAAGINGIGANLSAANAAAAGPTSGLAAAAADEVSEALANAFGAYGTEYQSLVGALERWHGQFAQTLTGAATAYAQTESAIVGALGLPSATGSAFSAAAIPPFPANLTTLILGPTGGPIPSAQYIAAANKLYVQAFGMGQTLQGLFTPEQLNPITGPKSLTLNQSVALGVTILDNQLFAELSNPANPNNTVTVFGYSQSSIISALEMQNLAAGTSAFGANPPNVNQLNFVLVGNEMNPNGGLLSRFPNLTIPSLGLTFYGAMDANTPYHVANYTLEYDGFADFPKYPLNVVSDVNAVAGIVFVHTTYLSTPQAVINSATTLTTSPGYTGNTTYFMIPTQNLPLLDPLRLLPGIGNPLADLIQPDLQVIVNLGYGDPYHGYSTSYANLPTPFGLWPSLPPGTVLNALAAGTQQGFHDFSADMGTMTAQAIAAPLALPAAPDFAAMSIPSPVQVANTLTSIVSTDYAVLLPTADIGTALVSTLPTYDAELFLDQLSQGNLINAIGFPIAADVGLGTVSGGVELLTAVSALTSNVSDIQSLFAS
jgi:PE-PPE domain/PE family